jgi:indoleamine 2,3-dioxygenase
MMRFINGLPHRPFPYFSVGHVFHMLNAAIFDVDLPESPAGFKLENYQVDYATGFFPQEPPPRLSGQFKLWEDALDDAEGKLSLGEDTRACAKATRPYGETWRERVRNVRMVTDTRLGPSDSLLLSSPCWIPVTWLTNPVSGNVPTWFLPS